MNDTEGIKDVLEHFKKELQTTQMLLKSLDERSKTYKTLCKIEHTDKIVIMALEKQILKKIEVWNGQASCPCCKALIGPVDLVECKPLFCSHCGQALKWGEDDGT